MRSPLSSVAQKSTVSYLPSLGCWLEWQPAQFAAKIFLPFATASLPYSLFSCATSSSRFLSLRAAHNSVGRCAVRKAAMSGRRSSMARKFGQSRRHCPMLNGVCPNPRSFGSSTKKFVRWFSQQVSEQEPILMYTRCTASSVPMLSSPPLRMCLIGSSGSMGSSAFLVRRSQHLSFCFGSHQQVSAFAPASHLWSVLYHLVISSLG